jgi:adenylosuccinate synthase
MSVTILVGGQYGSEGKGKMAAFLASEFEMSIRTGGPNAGHTIEHNSRVYKLQSIPCAFVNPKCVLGIGAGGLIDPAILRDEIHICNIQPGQLLIDPQAGIIDPKYAEEELQLKESIGSTGKGVGAAIIDKIRRSGGFRFAHDLPELRDYLGDIAGTANRIIDRGGHVFLEGTQGFGLSLHHGIYPFVTGRETTAGTLCGDAGLSPILVDEIILVIRTYPIRVAGTSGPMGEEVDWDTVTSEAGSPTPLIEITTVSKNVRRVARFDLDLVKRAVLINRPTQIAVNFIDYLDYSDRGKRTVEDLSEKSRSFIGMIERETEVPVTLIGTGPTHGEIIDLRGSKWNGRLR